MGKSNSSLQMPSTRRSRGLFLTWLILTVVILYYLDFFDVFIGRKPYERNTISKESSQYVVPDEKSLSVPSTRSDLGYYTKTPTPTSIIIPSTQTSLWEHKSVAPQTTSSTLAVAVTSTPYPTSSQHSVSPDEVLLIFKTGASTIWRRIPLHLTTTLQNNKIPYKIIYSDLPETLSRTVTALDILANVSSIIKDFDPTAYGAYLDQKDLSHLNTYREHGRLPGDEPPDSYAGNQPGWLLDKYKFLPMLEHAVVRYPEKKWYIYIEDDTFIFWDNVLAYLDTLDSDDEPSYYGAFSGEGSETFAQGGSGIVFSRALMKSIFQGDSVPTLEKYGNETSKSCCGDIMLGKVLRDYGVKVNKGTWGPVGFRPEPPWKTGFDANIWCKPVFTFHHLHQRDLVMLSEFERELKELGAGRPIIFEDIYNHFISPHITNSTRRNWDNFAYRYILTSKSTPHEDLAAVPEDILEAASSSQDDCLRVCEELETCMGWRHDSAKQECGLDTVVILGRETDPQPVWEEKTVVTSGWMADRIENTLGKEECEVVGDY